MSPRLSNLGITLFGAVVVVASLAFASVVAAWLTFGVGIELLVLLCASQLDELRPVKQRLVDAVTAGLAVWAATAAALFTGRTLTRVSLAEACAFVLLGLAGLVLYEPTPSVLQARLR